jgi:hypothetical protein
MKAFVAAVILTVDYIRHNSLRQRQLRFLKEFGPTSGDIFYILAVR